MQDMHTPGMAAENRLRTKQGLRRRQRRPEVGQHASRAQQDNCKPARPACRVIESEKAIWPIERMRELREVSRSGSSGGARHLTAACPRGSDELDSKVLHVTRASDGVYDAPPILADLRAAGERVSRKTVAGWLRRQHPAEISPCTFAPTPR
jgi:hypothetical protein